VFTTHRRLPFGRVAGAGRNVLVCNMEKRLMQNKLTFAVVVAVLITVLCAIVMYIQFMSQQPAVYPL
jgi:hypothetical protein